jgi:hypothetical protein
MSLPAHAKRIGLAGVQLEIAVHLVIDSKVSTTFSPTRSISHLRGVGIAAGEHDASFDSSYYDVATAAWQPDFQPRGNRPVNES